MKIQNWNELTKAVDPYKANIENQVKKFNDICFQFEGDTTKIFPEFKKQCPNFANDLKNLIEIKKQLKNHFDSMYKDLEERSILPKWDLHNYENYIKELERVIQSYDKRAEFLFNKNRSNDPFTKGAMGLTELAKKLKPNINHPATTNKDDKNTQGLEFPKFKGFK